MGIYSDSTYHVVANWDDFHYGDDYSYGGSTGSTAPGDLHFPRVSSSSHHSYATSFYRVSKGSLDFSNHVVVNHKLEKTVILHPAIQVGRDLSFVNDFDNLGSVLPRNDNSSVGIFNSSSTSRGSTESSSLARRGLAWLQTAFNLNPFPAMGWVWGKDEFEQTIVKRARSPCDPHGMIKLSSGPDGLVGREGRFCDNTKHPLNTICVRQLPRDWCPSVRPKTVYLPPRWRPAFVLADQAPNFATGDYAGPGYYSNVIPSIRPGQTKPEKGKIRVVADDGDICCNAMDEDENGVDQAYLEKQGGRWKTNCEDHWNKPWCVTPTAFYRYMSSHPGWLDINCDASLAPRMGVIGAICHQQDMQLVDAVSAATRDPHSRWQARYDELTKKLEPKPDESETDPEANVDYTNIDTRAQTALDAPPGSAPANFGEADPYAPAGALGLHSWDIDGVAPPVQAGGDFGVYGGRVTVVKSGPRTTEEQQKAAAERYVPTPVLDTNDTMPGGEPSEENTATPIHSTVTTQPKDTKGMEQVLSSYETFSGSPTGGKGWDSQASPTGQKPLIE